jgi:hypothetical protein
MLSDNNYTFTGNALTLGGATSMDSPSSGSPNLRWQIPVGLGGDVTVHTSGRQTRIDGALGLGDHTLTLDAEVPLPALTFGLLQEIDRLEPYGSENARPVFLAGGLEIVGEPRLMGSDERHMQFRVRQAGTTLRAVAFGMAERIEELMSGEGRCCLAFTPVINEWQGYRSVELHVVDMQAGMQAKLG